MGIMDGAANGLKLRLEAVGVPSAIAYTIGQVAYVPSRKRPRWVPDPVVAKSEVTWLVSQVEQELRRVTNPAAKSSWVWALCMRVFGAESGSAVFGMGYPDGPTGTVAVEEDIVSIAEEWDAIFTGAFRYFESVDLNFSGDRFMAPATMFRGSGDEQRHWEGFILTMDGMIGYFEESDCLAEDVEDGDPLVHKLSMLTACSVRMPAVVRLPPGLSHISFREPAGDLSAKLTFEGDPNPMQVALLFEDLEEDLKEQAAQNMQQLLILANKAIGLRSPSLG